MSILHLLQVDLRKQGKDIAINEETLDISATDVMRLNNEIEMQVDDNRVMLEASPGKAARYACSK